MDPLVLLRFKKQDIFALKSNETAFSSANIKFLLIIRIQQELPLYHIFVI